jgi:hypothetical protein
MKQTSKYSAKSIANISFCLLIILLIDLGCTGTRKPWRDYSDKTFNSEEWLAGDEIERGRMYGNLFISRKLDGKSREDVVKLLGEPYKKLTVEGREVWLYRIENRFGNDLNIFPVSFDGKKGAFAGGVRGGTISMIVDDEWVNKGE